MTLTKETNIGTGVFEKMLAVMEKVQYIQKDAENVHDRYTYASERAIKAALSAALREVGLLFQISTSNPRVVKSEAVSPKGEITWRNVTWIDVTYRFIDAETGNYLEGTFLGSGQARDEKGHYAAVTGAIKYILTSSFLIPTGDDAESDENIDVANENVVKPAPRRRAMAQADNMDEPPPHGEHAAPPKGRGRTSSRARPAQTRRPGPTAGRTDAAPRPPSDAQNKFLAALVNERLEFADDREAVHEWMTGILGKMVTSQKNLTMGDASELIQRLQAMPKLDDPEGEEEPEDDLPF